MMMMMMSCIQWINLYQVGITQSISFPNTSLEDNAIQRLNNRGPEIATI